MPRARYPFIFLALLLVLAAPAVAKKGGGGNRGGEYDVTVSGDLFPGEPLPDPYPYSGEDGNGSGTPVHVYFQDLNLDLSFFYDKFDGDGAACFTGAHGGSNGTPMIISQERNGDALVRYWFLGFGIDGVGGPEIQYQLLMFGRFADTGGSAPWRPGSGQFTTLELDGWEMVIEGKKHKRIACRGYGPFTVVPGQAVTVTRTN